MKLRWLFSTVTVLVLLPGLAHADGWVAPHIGVNFGGDSGDTFSSAVQNQSDVTYGVALGGMSGGVLGTELDLGYTPKAFGADSLVESSHLFTLMGNLLIGVPVGGHRGAGVRPYFAAGVGLIRRNVTFGDVVDGLSTSDFGYDLGGGLMGFFSDHVGVRGDYRYFRNFKKEEDEFLGLGRGPFSFSRFDVALILRF
jgi:opacity protein-like surface antigen